MLALPTSIFLEQIAFSGRQQTMKIPYTSCASSTASEVFLSLAILMKTHERKSDFPVLSYQIVHASHIMNTLERKRYSENR